MLFNPDPDLTGAKPFTWHRQVFAHFVQLRFVCTHTLSGYMVFLRWRWLYTFSFPL